jgi:hypothetical protein
MSDKNTALPVRTEGDAEELLVSRIADGTTGANKLTVHADGLAHVEVHGNNPAGNDEVLRLSELGAPNPDGDYHATDNTKPASSGLIAHDRGAAIDETSQNKRVTAVGGTDNTVCLDVAIRDEAGAAFSRTNPLPVEVTEATGDEVYDYQTSADLAAAASINLDYTVSASRTLEVAEVKVSGSGKLKAELKVETAAASGTYNTKEVSFNSTALPNIVMESHRLLKQVTGAKVRITITNLDNQAQDVYMSLKGLEVA